MQADDARKAEEVRQAAIRKAALVQATQERMNALKSQWKEEDGMKQVCQVSNAASTLALSCCYALALLSSATNTDKVQKVDRCT